MRIAIEETGVVIPMDKLAISTFRTDLTPIPANLELTVKLDDELEKQLVNQAVLLVGNDEIRMTIVKVMGVNTQIVLDDKRVKIVSIIAVLSGCEALIDPLKKAVILSGTNFAEAYRSSGSKLKFNKDIPLLRFVSAYGSMPTAEIANCLLEESAMVCLDGSKLSVKRLPAFFDQEPVMTLDNGSVAWVNNPTVENHHIPTFVSVGEDGAVIHGNRKDKTPTKYYPDADARRLKNLNTILVTRGSATRTMDMNVVAGDVFLIDDEKYLVLTAAHFFKSGAMGGGTASASRYWLATLSK